LSYDATLNHILSAWFILDIGILLSIDRGEEAAARLRFGKEGGSTWVCVWCGVRRARVRAPEIR